MEALEKLKQMTAWDKEPELTEDELEEMLGAAALVDTNGFAPLHEEWSPTYDINAAAAAAWLIKAARAAATVEQNPPGSGLYTSAVSKTAARNGPDIYRKTPREHSVR